MANIYTQIYIHVTFAVEGRQNLISPQHNDELQKFSVDYDRRFIFKTADE
jgi:hypothetical protein